MDMPTDGFGRRRLDSELAGAIAAFKPGDRLDPSRLLDTRKLLRILGEARCQQSPHIANASFENHTLAIADHSHALTVRITRPKDAVTERPGLLWMHGGGLIAGYVEQDDPILSHLASTVGCVIVSVDYRLAPEHPFPAAIEDCWYAYRWMRKHARSLGIDADRIAVGGASAGGGLAAVLSLMARDRGFVPPLFQSLIYPMLDDRNMTASSHQIADLGIWDRDANVWAWRAYLASEDAGGRPYAAAARAIDLSAMPPSFIAVGELDVFRDENIDFARRLIEAGSPTELHVYPGAYHAFDVLAPNAAITRSFLATWHAFVARMFATPCSRQERP